MCEIVLQIYAGGFSGASVTFDAVKAKLDAVLPALRPSKLIVGWPTRMQLYERLCDYARCKGMEVYLWLPVFSEVGALRPCSPVIGYNGAPISGGGWQDGETFEFYCPNDERNINNVIEAFEEHYASAGFTGVFLDKIRYPSFANGVGGAYTCFCQHCISKYVAHGFDAGALKRLIKRTPQAPTPLGILRYEDCKYAFNDSIWSAFYTLKSTFITNAISKLYGYFSAQGYKVGLDVLAPFAGYFTGQDIAALSAYCDFIKPMLYRITRAPAGLPYELGAIGKGIYGVLGIEEPAYPFDMDFTLRELKAIVAMARCPVYAGVEVNRKEGVADADPYYVRETARAYLDAGAAGLVLSWDLMDAPLENVMSVLEDRPPG